MLDLKKVLTRLITKFFSKNCNGVASQELHLTSQKFFCVIEINMCQLIMSRLPLKKSPTEFHKVQS